MVKSHVSFLDEKITCVFLSCVEVQYFLTEIHEGNTRYFA